jgi:hypothetical protein
MQARRPDPPPISQLGNTSGHAVRASGSRGDPAKNRLMSLRLKHQSNGRAAVFVTRFERGESICHHMKRAPVD